MSASSQPMARLDRPDSSPLDPAWLLERHLTRDVRDALAAHARGLVVDVGCGGRPYEAFVPSGARYVGFDATPTLGSRPDGWARADAIPLASGIAQLVLCTQVLEHVPNPAECVREMARVLAPGGCLVITAPQAWNLHEAPHDYFRYTRYGLTSLCERAGLEVTEVRPQGGLWALVGISILMCAGMRVLGTASRPPAGSGTAGVANLLRWPLACHNVLFASLDGWKSRGVGGGAFAVNHLVVATKPVICGQSPDANREARR